MAEDPLKYDALIERALKGVVREVLETVREEGLPGEHHFYITFRTEYPGVEIADHLRERYPGEMTIVLQHQFWGLEVEPTRFSVSLSFSGVPHKLVVPYAAIVAFADPSVRFGLQFENSQDGDEPEEEAAPETPDETAPEAEEAPQDKVITLDSFRKR
ncbi:MAG: ClpXP protease specificity-enhancing factor SspB [Pseudomonadota bacterium]